MPQPTGLPTPAGPARRTLLQSAVTCAAGAVLTPLMRPAFAQTLYPSKAVTWVVPQPPGGDADAVCRMLQARMQQALGQPLVIENRAGAAGNIGAAYGAKAAPDGYTLTFVNQGILAFNPTLYGDAGFSAKSFTPITWMTTTDLVICARASAPFKSLRELIQAAREKPAHYTYGTAGNGSANHIAGKLLEQMAGIQLIHVPYKGGSPAIVDALGGQIDLVVAFPLGALPHIKSGKLLPLAVTGPRRAAALADVPTVAEQGIDGYAFSSWFGLMAPAGTPREVVDKVHQATAAALREPATVERLRAGMTEPIGQGPEAFAQLIAQETQRWPALIRQYGIRVD